MIPDSFWNHHAQGANLVTCMLNLGLMVYLDYHVLKSMRREKICGQRCPRRVKLKYPDTDIRSNQAVRKKDDMRYKLAIFDLDGTILDTLEDRRQHELCAVCLSYAGAYHWFVARPRRVTAFYQR